MELVAARSNFTGIALTIHVPPDSGVPLVFTKIEEKKRAVQPMLNYIVDGGPDQETQEDVACGVAACQWNIYWNLHTIHVFPLSERRHYALYFWVSNKNHPLSLFQGPVK